MECLIVIVFFILYTSHISCDNFNILRFRNITVEAHLICITDETNNAIVWNEEEDVEPSKTEWGITYPDSQWLDFMNNGSFITDRQLCSVHDRFHDCKFSFVGMESDWKITSSTDVPMGPVFDSRFERFWIQTKLKFGLPYYQPVTVNRNGVRTNLIFDYGGTLVVSIRGNTNANFLMCTDSDYSKSFCYWIIVGALANATALRKCSRGVSVNPEYQDCVELRVAQKHNPLSIHEWKTFVITLDAMTKSIKLYDPDAEILSYTDDTQNDNSTSFYILFGGSEIEFRTRYRFHEYIYYSTTKPGAQYDSFKYKIDKNSTKEICIDMMIGLCASCELSVRLVDPADDRELAKKIISSTIPTRNVQHGLPMWQNVRIRAPNNNRKREFVMIKITTKSTDGQVGNHWAIGDVQQCLPEGSIKRMHMVSQGNDSTWPNATCQKLSYDQEHRQTIRSNMELTSPPDNVTLCPESRVGPKCSTNCNGLPKWWTCQGVSICDENRCYCSSGHTAAAGCYGTCDWKSGEFGYNCREKCENCRDKRCSVSTGRCTFGCNKLEGEYRFVPPFCTNTVRFPKLQSSQMDSQTVRVYFPKVDHDEKLQIVYEFELQVNDNTTRKQNSAMGKDGAKKPIYFTIFNDLSPGMRLQARIIQHIQFESIDGVENLQLEGNFSKQWTTCMWTSNFSIESKNKVLIIDRKESEQESFRCHDEYFVVKAIPIELAVNESRTIDTIDIIGTFPMTITNLKPETKYEISITGLNSSVSHRQEVQTVPSIVKSRLMKESPVVGFKIDNVTSTEVSVSWLPQEDPNDMIYGYSLTIKALYHKGCINDRSAELMNAQLHNITNFTQSYTIHDLVPYVRYELTILAHHAQRDDKSSISFITNATDIPTVVFQNLTFGKGKIKWSTRVADCSAVTGPLRATRLFFFGESQNVKDFIDQYDSMSDSFKLNETKKQDIFGCEKYRVRIHALRDINGKHNESVYTEISFTADPRAPESPGAVDITDIGQGMIDVDWNHPPETGGKIREFLIECRMISTNLTKGIWNFERHIISIYHTRNYQEFHTTRLNLLPSTSYEMKISGVVECAKDILIGNPSRIIFETQSSFAWYKDEPSYIVDMSNHSIILTLPKIDNVTVDCEIHVLVIGNDLCKEIPTLSEPLTRIVGLENNEKAWHINSSFTSSSSSSSSSISIGSYVGDGNITNCSLVVGSTYKIAIIVTDDDIDVSNQPELFVWRSKLIYMGLTTRHEFWAIPLSLLFLIGCILIIFCWKRTRRQRIKKVKQRALRKPLVEFKRQSNTPEYQEPSLLYPAVHTHDQYLTPINTHLYEEIESKTLVKLDKFQDYVKDAIASGELLQQYSLMSPGQVQSWEDGLLSDHANGDEYNNAFAVDEMVVVLEDPNDPYFECTNAHYIKGYKKNKAYIVLQGQPNTTTNFWRVVWQERVEVICTISHSKEDEQAKHDEHWPELDKSMSFGDISVENISQTPFADYTFRTLGVKRNEEMRVINHLHYTAWPDYEIPLYTQSIVTYLKKLFEVPTSGPVLVHCIVDLSRTGTLILLDICHRRGITESVVDVFTEVERMRKQLANMVNTKQQYIFAHLVLVDCLLTPSSAIMCDDSIIENIDEQRNRFKELQKHTDHCVMLNQMIQSLIQPQLKLSENNINKNRFTESLPMTRLYLPRYPISDDESSYISGVYVDSSRRKNSYIASQLPLPTTMTDFWRMIAAFKIELIIILQQPDIQDSSCCKFVPAPVEEIDTHSFFSIEGKSISNGEYFLRQKIILKDRSMESLSEQLVTILTCKGWDLDRDKRLPTPAALIDLYQTAERIANRDKPTVVLCYDGVTGCGLYLALSILLERISLEHECDVGFAIRSVRRSRSEFCHTQDQFQYLYNAALFYISETEKIS